MQALQLLQELASVSEKLWNAHIAKLLEYNKTHEVKMKEETVTIEDGETYIVCFGRRKDTETEHGRMRIIIRRKNKTDVKSIPGM